MVSDKIEMYNLLILVSIPVKLIQPNIKHVNKKSN